MKTQILSLLVTFVVLTLVKNQELMSDVLKTNADFITFNNLLKRANLVDVLNKGKYIVFGVTDAALSTLSQKEIDHLFDNSYLDELTRRLKYHIVPWTQGGDIPTHWSGESLPTLANSSLRIASYAHKHVTIVNGISFHDPGFNVSNGKLFSLKQMLDVPSHSDIYSLLLHSRTYNSFLTAATLGGMIQDLRADNITVFAPSDDAFNNLPISYRDRIFKSVLRSRNLVKLHVVRGIYFTKGMYGGEHLNTLSQYGQGLPVQVRGHMILVNPGATVTAEDWLATNGVIQGVDKIVVPHHFHTTWWG